MVTAAEVGRPRGGQDYVVARTDEIPEGERIIVEVAGKQVGIFNVDGEYYAILNRCPHLAGPLCEGQVVKSITANEPGQMVLDEQQSFITCPWHNWEFDLRTGQSFWNPERLKARPVPLSVHQGATVRCDLEDGSAERVPGPYKAETLPVSVDAEYIVITMRAPRPER